MINKPINSLDRQPFNIIINKYSLSFINFFPQKGQLLLVSHAPTINLIIILLLQVTHGNISPLIILNFLPCRFETLFFVFLYLLKIYVM